MKTRNSIIDLTHSVIMASCSSAKVTTETQETNGTISIALVNAKTDELLWIGHKTKEISSSSKRIEKNINKSIEKIFYEFPESIILNS